MIKFSKIEKDNLNNSVKTFYNDNEEAIECIPKQNNDISILIIYLETGFDALTMTAHSLTGFAPKYSWINKNIHLPNFTYGLLKLEADIDEGSYRIDKNDDWQFYFDEKSKWLLITTDYYKNDEKCHSLQNFMFINNVIASISIEGELKRIYVKL